MPAGSACCQYNLLRVRIRISCLFSFAWVKEQELMLSTAKWFQRWISQCKEVGKPETPSINWHPKEEKGKCKLREEAIYHRHAGVGMRSSGWYSWQCFCPTSEYLSSSLGVSSSPARCEHRPWKNCIELLAAAFSSARRCGPLREHAHGLELAVCWLTLSPFLSPSLLLSSFHSPPFFLPLALCLSRK